MENRTSPEDAPTPNPGSSATAITAAPSNALKVTDTTARTCRPFVLQVMVFAPKSGYKIEVDIEKTCTPQADPLWKLVFDLYKQQATGTGFDQLVHISYTGGTPVEQHGLEATGANGINGKQADVIINRIGPAVADLENAPTMTPEQLAATKAQIKAAGSDVANFAL
jgi:hypothetical protein